LKKEIKEDTRSWKHFSYSWIDRTSTAEMSILLKVIYRINAIIIKILMSLFTETEKSILIFIWKHKRPWIVKAALSKKKTCWRYHNTWIQIILQSHSNKIAHVDQWKRRPRKKPTQLQPSDFWQRCKNHLLENRQSFQQMMLGKLDIQM
jgi:hypothetical protein